MTDNQRPDWDQIVEEHAGRVFRIALRILGSVSDAEDVAQDVFVEAIRLHRAGSVSSWDGLLVRLATLRAIDRLRRNRPTHEVLESDRVSVVGPFEEAVANELAQWLRAAIGQLPQQQAVVFMLTYVEQLSRDEVAASLGISAESVSTTLYKARQRLRTQLAVFNQGDSK